MKRIFWIGLILIVFVIVAWSCTMILLWYDEKTGVGEIGQFGDIFGSTNALFSGLAFVGIIITIIIQSRELELQREELKETRNIFEQQTTQYKFQQRENTFFNLLSHHSKIIEGFTEKESEGMGNQKTVYILNGYRAFISVWNSTKKSLEYSKQGKQSELIHSSSSIERDHPWRIISKHDTYRQIYYSVIHILEFIKENLDNIEFYHKTVFNSLSKEEREIISLLNEYHQYFDSKKIDFNDYSIQK